MTYSVLNEPVFPVIWNDGKRKDVGLRDAFLYAHEIRDIQGDNPLERYALLRLLIAFSMDMLHPKNSYARRALLDKQRFDPGTLEAYISECESAGPRFDLFDSNHPFLQTKYDEIVDKKAEKSVAVIIHSLPSGNNHIFIDHRKEDSQSVSYSKAFRALVASYLFCVSGTAGPSSVNNTPPLYTIVVGDNLFETIIINMLSEQEVRPLPYGIGEVPWRNYPDVIPKQKIATVSLLEGLTWMPRRILLIPEEDNSVHRVICQAGLDFQGNDLWNDPHVPRFKKKDGTYGTVKPELGRALWRDVGTLLYDHNSAVIRQPQILRCLLNIFDEDEIPIWIKIRAVGLITNQAAYTHWYESELSLPSQLLHIEESASIFRSDVAMVEAVQDNIFCNVQKYVDLPRPESDSKEHEIASQCQQYFLQLAYELLFGPAIDGILKGSNEKEHVEKFCDDLKKLITATMNRVLYISGFDTRSIQRQIEAEKWIWIRYKEIVEERKKAYA